MSDSLKEENKQALKTAEQVSLVSDQKSPMAKSNMLPLPILVVTILAILGLFAFIGIIGYEYINSNQKNSAKLSQVGTEQSNGLSEETVSILPEKPDGITILEKQLDQVEPADEIILSPSTQGSSLVTGFAADLGSALSFRELSDRFALIVETNGVENFTKLEPRAVLKETVNGLEARLFVGPFKSEADVIEACQVIERGEDIPCSPVIFEGELISRQ